jgi:hypothetical protein
MEAAIMDVKLEYGMQDKDDRTVDEFWADYEKMKKKKPAEFKKFCDEHNWDPVGMTFKPMKYLQPTKEELAFAKQPWHITKLCGKSFRDKMDSRVDAKTAFDGYKLCMILYTASW